MSRIVRVSGFRFMWAPPIPRAIVTISAFCRALSMLLIAAELHPVLPASSSLVTFTLFSYSAINIRQCSAMEHFVLSLMVYPPFLIFRVTFQVIISYKEVRRDFLWRNI